MFWLDLIMICFGLWGGVSGYLCGWSKASRQLVAIIITFLAAAAVTEDIKHFVSLHYPMDEKIEVLIYSRIVIPVSGDPSSRQEAVLDAIALPAAIRSVILSESSLVVVSAFNDPLSVLADMMFNTFAFMLAIALWWGFFHLIGPHRLIKYEKLKECERLGGLIAGIFRQVLIIIVITGITAPFLWLLAAPGEILDLQQAVIARWSLQLFGNAGIWLK